MKALALPYILLFCLLFQTEMYSQFANINEIHYDNTGADVGEFVEIKITDPQPANLSEYVVSLYNGNDGSVYDSQSLDNFTATTDMGATYYTWYPSSIQNGAPDGICLSDDTGVVEFLSYEGVFTATAGPASGMSSSNMIESESGTTPVGTSMQVIGGSWQTEVAQTPGADNEMALPLEITSLDIVDDRLLWTVNNENNFYAFLPQNMQEDGSWMDLEKIEYRKGQTDYSTDLTEGPQSTPYYRLLAVDNDGSRQLSPIVKLLEQNSTLSVERDGLRIIVKSTGDKFPTNISVSSLNGQLLYTVTTQDSRHIIPDRLVNTSQVLIISIVQGSQKAVHKIAAFGR